MLRASSIVALAAASVFSEWLDFVNFHSRRRGASTLHDLSIDMRGLAPHYEHRFEIVAFFVEVPS